MKKRTIISCTPKNKDYSSTILLEDQFLYGIKYIYMVTVYIFVIVCTHTINIIIN